MRKVAWQKLISSKLRLTIRALICSATGKNMDSSQVQNSEFTTEFWNKRWAENRAGWHKTAVNEILEKYADKLLGNGEKKRVLFPLCGKTVDMKWIAEKGHFVVGVDGSETAAISFFEESNIEYKRDAINMAPRGAQIFSSLDDKIRIFICDMYSFRSSVAGGKFDAVFDRGALVAINPKDRPKYAELMAELMAPGGKILAEVLEYDPTVYSGPPHHVPEHHIREIYGNHFDVIQLEKEIDNTPKYKEQWNIDLMHKCAYLMTRK